MKKFNPLKKFKALHHKAKGEWAELAFMVKATALGLTVCKPYGENQPFDFIASPRGGAAIRVQVKSCWTREKGWYHVHAQRCGRRYKPGELDYFVVLIPPENAWYIVPLNVFPRSGFGMFCPHRPGSHAKFEKYRNAWHLLTGDPADDTRTLGLTIHAMAEERWNAAAGPAAQLQLAL